MGSIRRSTFGTGLVIGLVLVLAAACGGGDGDDEETSPTGETEDVALTIPAEGDPVEGGALTVGLEAETDGWDPVNNRWAASGHTVALAIYDPLATWTPEGEVAPYLAEAFEPSDDFMTWDIVLRPDISFHNGEPLNAAAVEKLLEAHKASALTAPALEPVESIDVVEGDDLRVRVTMNQPWSVFPVVLTGQPGYVAAPEQLDAGEQASLRAIGTGPFIQDEWVPDREFVATRNPDYWREGLPYLEEVTFLPIPDVQTRMDTLETGGLNITATTDDQEIVNARDDAEAGDLQLIEDGSSGEETLVMLNTMVPPLDDIRVRQALAYATNKDAYIETLGSGIFVPANGPFTPSSRWYNPEVEETYPQYDPERARQLVDEYEAENGPIRFEFTSPPVLSNQEIVALLATQWAEVGIETEQTAKEQATFILDAVTGDFEANLWRQFGTPDPDGDYVWWAEQNANDIGEFSLNMARNRDSELTDALNRGRQTDDFDERKAAYDEVQVRLDEDLPYIWLTHTLWALIADDQVRNVGVWTLPDGEPAMPFLNGRFSVVELWMAR
jgi:ABC-type transport system substrate-binding protein